MRTTSRTTQGTSLPLKELSVEQLYNTGEVVYEIPIYQRNFAWGSDEISTLIRDIHDACLASDGKTIYRIGTLVTFPKGDNVFEVIDGQQRLTAINLIMHALNVTPTNRLTYRSRKKANLAISSLPNPSMDDTDPAIARGFAAAKDALETELFNESERNNFKDFLLHNVHIVHYQVPNDVDLNHYFEVMNSRGKQLERHEIVKAKLLEKLDNPCDRGKLSLLWDTCSRMSTYVQKSYGGGDATRIFGKGHDNFIVSHFGELPAENEHAQRTSIRDLLTSRNRPAGEEQDEGPNSDAFQPIINFPNFLLVVLKLTMIEIAGTKSTIVTLNDKELIAEFDEAMQSTKQSIGAEEFVRLFGFNLMKAKYLLDNYVVHHLKREDAIGDNPWKLQHWCRTNDGGHDLRNLSENACTQNALVHLLSMYEVCFTANQRKNYLLYCLLYLFDKQDGANGYDHFSTEKYAIFLERMGRKFLNDIYLDKDRLNEHGAPVPGAFDAVMLANGRIDTRVTNPTSGFEGVYEPEGEAAKTIPLFVFNYLDYLLWKRYSDELRGSSEKKSSPGRVAFFENLGCSDFGLDAFKQFYFSRTRNSLEHFFPQANASGKDGMPDIPQVNRFGNYAMIGSGANSSGSNWSPVTKLAHYLDTSGKVSQVGVASLKLLIMMQRCKDNEGKRPAGREWLADDIREHQEKMVRVLLGDEDIV